VSLRSRGGFPEANTDIYVADTLGELGLMYRVAPIAFVGGSLVPHGGQNPIEPVKLGTAVLHGPHIRNFAEIYGALDAAKGAIEIHDADELVRRIGRWLDKPDLRRAAADVARETVDQMTGALERTLAALEPYLMQLQLERPEHA
jgi:3-deoxy-D-manno-octulosonic-acid transferase